MAKYLDLSGLEALWAKIKAKFLVNVSKSGDGLNVVDGVDRSGFKISTISLMSGTAATIGGVKLTDTINESDDVNKPIVPTPKAVADAINLAITDAGAATQVYAHVSGDSGTANASTNNDTITIVGGTGISTEATNGGADADTLTVNLDLATSSTIGGVKLTDTVDESDSDDVSQGFAVTPKGVADAIKNAGAATKVFSKISTPGSLSGLFITINADNNDDTLTFKGNGINVILSETNNDETITLDLKPAYEASLGGVRAGVDNRPVNGNNLEIKIIPSGSTSGGYLFTTIPDASSQQWGVMSSSDYTKLAGIAAGAEVNQNAFGRINASGTILVADESEDTLTVKGDTGSSITIDGTVNTDTLTIGLGYATATKVGGVTVADRNSIVDGLNNDNINEYSSYLSTGIPTVNVPLAVASGTSGARNGLMSSSMLLQLNTATSDIETLKTTVASAFTYQVESDASILSSTPTAANMYIIYFVPIADADDSDDSDESTDASHNGKHLLYAEYIAVNKGSNVYIWERLGTTDVNIDSITNAMINSICV